MALSPHCSLPKNSFVYSFFKGGLWVTLAPLTLKAGDWNSTHNHLGPRDVQPCPVFLSFFSNQIHKAKSLKKINVIVTYLRPLKFQGHLEHQRGNTSPSSWLVSNLNFAQPGVPWGNIRHFSKLPEGWEENASLCESMFMLPRQPRFCVVWMRSRCSLDSKMGVSQSPCAGLPPEVTTAWVFPLCLEHSRDSLEYCFLLLHGGRSADEIKTRLEGQRERNFHSSALQTS